LKDFPAIHIQPLGGDTYLNNEQPVKLLVCDVVLNIRLDFDIILVSPRYTVIMIFD